MKTSLQFMGTQGVQLANGFYDELLKIAEVKKNPDKEKLKRWLKATAVLSAGYGLGHGTAYVLDRVTHGRLSALAPSNFNNKFVGPISMGVGGALAAYILKKRSEQHAKMVRGED